MALLEPGTELARYTILGKLATGGMSEIYLARQTGPSGFSKVLVLKVILPHLAEDPAFMQMFQNEAKLAALLNHPNVVQIFDFGLDQQRHFMVMEYIDGRNLRRIMKALKQADRRFPIALALRVISDTCGALEYAHSLADPEGRPLSIIHRDVSLENILLTYSGQVKIVDFGIAKAAILESHSHSGILKGKYSYMAPELIRGERPDRRVDVYSVGVVLYTLLLGRLPISGGNHAQVLDRILYHPPPPPRAIDASLPEELERILNKVLHKDPDQRYQRAGELQTDLELYLQRTNNTVMTSQLVQFMNQTFRPGTDEDREAFRALSAGAAVGLSRSDQPEADTPFDGTELYLPPGDENGWDQVPVHGEPAASTDHFPNDASIPLELIPLALRRNKKGITRPLVLVIAALLTGALTTTLVMRLPKERHPGGDPAPRRDAIPLAAAMDAGAWRDAAEPAAITAPDSALPDLDPPPPEDAGAAAVDLAQATRPAESAVPAPPKRVATSRRRPKVGGLLSVSARFPGKATIDGQALGPLPLSETPVRPGKHRLVVFGTRPRYRVVRRVTIKPGQHQRLEISPLLGRIKVLARPWAKVVLDGKTLGVTPIPPVPVYEGSHLLTLENMSLKSRKRLQVEVKPGRVSVVKVRMDQAN